MIKWALVIIATFIVASMIATWAFGKFALRLRGPDSYALAVAADQTHLDRTIGAATAAHPGETGLFLIDDNLDAFAARGITARLAERSLDLIYYIWHDDLTGQLLMAEAMAAAQRGVRVRILLDDIGTAHSCAFMSAMSHHRLINIRIFNPTAQRPGSFRRAVEMALRAFSVNRRMHNKGWIADGRVAILGGRNIGDAYFDADQGTNFRDMDVLVIGPAVDQTQAMFDDYWNSAMALPAERLNPLTDPGAKLARMIPAMAAFVKSAKARPYLTGIAERSALLHPTEAMFDWTDTARVIADPPDKALGKQGDNWLMGQLLPILGRAQHRLEITSPYFIPGDEGLQALTTLADRGVAVGVLTNSLSATDVAAVHGGYAPYRVPLLQAGVNLFEQRRDIKRRLRLRGSSGASLHTKAFLVDGRHGFIGSMNFDPRSLSLNTEMGLLFDCLSIGARMENVWRYDISPEHSYRLTLCETNTDAIIWHSEVNGTSIQYDDEPHASWWRKTVATVIGTLPLESQL